MILKIRFYLHRVFCPISPGTPTLNKTNSTRKILLPCVRMEHHSSHHSAQKLFHFGCGHESKRGRKYTISSSHSKQVLIQSENDSYNRTFLKNRLAICNKLAKNKSLSSDHVINWEFPALVKGLTTPSHDIIGTIIHTYFPQTLLEIVMERLS